ncbi:AAA family ATPase [Cohnella boryungensis]|uniref:AAA family ATPase n=1 Tax=Cohnella boryungensis TaxID=768479 RepID=A0ABV8SDI5_9BACL
MNIAYVWLDNYKNVYKKQGFNFGGAYQFSYNPRKGELVFTKNEAYLPDFFQIEQRNPEIKATISGITAIVGENGAGKTSFLDFLKHDLVYGRSVLRSKALVVIELKPYSYLVVHHEAIKLDLEPERDNLFFYTQTYNNNKTNKLYPKGFRNLEQTSFIFFSNVADYRMTEVSRERLINISTNYLMKADAPDGDGHAIQHHRNREIRRQINFIQNAGDLLDVLPSDLRRRIPDTLELFYPEVEVEDGEFSAEMIDFLAVLRGIMPRNHMNDILYDFIVNTLLELGERGVLNKLRIDPYLRPFYEHRPRETDGFALVTEVLERLQQFVGDLDDKSALKISLSKKRDLVSILKEEYRKETITVTKRKRIRIERNDSEVLGLLMEAYYSSIISKDFFQFDWKDMSSGQKAFLSMCARFFSIVNQARPKLRNHAIILIDEGELYFHPQWQKELLYQLVVFLPALFSRSPVQTIQIVMTSNSPFVVSDLPTSNVIFLKYNGESTEVMQGLEEHHKTFASNIHALYAHSFFLQDGMMGKFAKTKINELIESLVRGSSIELDRESVKKTIEMIGEPVLRNKLLMMYREKMTFLRDERMDRMENELNALHYRITEMERPT